MFGGRSRTCSESSEGGGAAADGGSGPRLGTSAPAGGFLTAGLLGQKAANNNNISGSPAGTAYDLEGKFTYSQVIKTNTGNRLPTTVDENGKFSYISSDMRPVPPGWYDTDKSKHRVPIGWYDQKTK